MKVLFSIGASKIGACVCVGALGAGGAGSNHHLWPQRKWLAETMHSKIAWVFSGSVPLFMVLAAYEGRKIQLLPHKNDVPKGGMQCNQS